jgi:hypothetical protein
MVDKNTYLTNIENKTLNYGIMEILRHTSVAVRRFGNRHRSRINHYSDRISILYNQWQEDMAKHKAGGTMAYADLGKGSTVEQFIKLTEHGCASELISHQIMKQAMGSPERMAEFLADKVEVAASRAAFEIDKKFIDDICKEDNYRAKAGTPAKSPAIIENDADDYKPGKDTQGMENIRKLVNSIHSTASAMKWPSKNFNKLNLVSASFDFKRMGLIISDEMYGQLEDYYGHAFNLEHTDLGRKFAWVEVLPIHEKGKNFILIDVDGYVCDIDEESPTGWDLTRQIFLETWYYKWVYAYQDVAQGHNMVCWSVKAPPINP